MDSIWVMLGLMLAISGTYALVERQEKKKIDKWREENGPFYFIKKEEDSE